MTMSRSSAVIVSWRSCRAVLLQRVHLVADIAVGGGEHAKPRCVLADKGLRQGARHLRHQIFAGEGAQQRHRRKMMQRRVQVARLVLRSIDRHDLPLHDRQPALRPMAAEGDAHLVGGDALGDLPREQRDVAHVRGHRQHAFDRDAVLHARRSPRAGRRRTRRTPRGCGRLAHEALVEIADEAVLGADQAEKPRRPFASRSRVASGPPSPTRSSPSMTAASTMSL